VLIIVAPSLSFRIYPSLSGARVATSFTHFRHCGKKPLQSLALFLAPLHLWAFLLSLSRLPSLSGQLRHLYLCPSRCCFFCCFCFTFSPPCCFCWTQVSFVKRPWILLLPILQFLLHFFTAHSKDPWDASQLFSLCLFLFFLFFHISFYF